MEEYKKKRIAFDVIALFKAIRQDKKKMWIYCGIAALLGVAVALDTPKRYTSGVMLTPESSESSGLSSNISSLASMIGMSMKLGSSSDAIYPEIYPDLMESNDFKVSLFPIEVETIDKKLKTTYYDYLDKHQHVSWYDYPIMWFKNLMKHLVSNPVPDVAPSADGKMHVNPFRLSRRQDDIATTIGKNLSCKVDKKTSAISIEVTDCDPLIAATMADSVKERLQAFITDYRTNKARHDLAYIEKLYDEAHQQYVQARQQYAAYSDANQELLLESYKSKQEDLENEMQLKFNVYSQMAMQLQLARAKVQEHTPAFTVIQSASVPILHSSKSKASRVLTYIAIGFFLRLVILMWKRRHDIVREVEA